jgi:hypothetical protein
VKLEINKSYFVRTDTDHWVGRLVEIDGPYTVTLTDAAWVAHSGRLHEFMRKGTASGMEVEPIYWPIMIHYRAIIEWPHSLFPEAV